MSTPLRYSVWESRGWQCARSSSKLFWWPFPLGVFKGGSLKACQARWAVSCGKERGGRRMILYMVSATHPPGPPLDIGGGVVTLGWRLVDSHSLDPSRIRTHFIVLHAPILTAECRKRSFHIWRKPLYGLTALFVYLQIGTLRCLWSCICKTDVLAWPLALWSCWSGENTGERCRSSVEYIRFGHSLPNHHIFHSIFDISVRIYSSSTKRVSLKLVNDLTQLY